MTAEELIAFEAEVATRMLRKEIHTPTHLCGGNEEQLIRIFKDIDPATDWVFCSYRNHYHALLFGVPREKVMNQIMLGRSMTPNYPGYRFFSTALVGGQLPVAVGAAMALKRDGRSGHVWVFCGDMASMTGAFHEAIFYSSGHKLPITFIVEDNGLSCDTPTQAVWGEPTIPPVQIYAYTRTQPHLGASH